MRTFFKLFLAILIIIVTVGITLSGIWVFNRPSPKENLQNNISPIITELEICKEFSKIAEEVSCEDAVKIAEGKYDSIAQSVSQGSKFRKKSDPNPEGKDVWIINILLNKPISKNQQIVTKATVFLDRKNGEELKISYL